MKPIFKAITGTALSLLMLASAAVAAPFEAAQTGDSAVSLKARTITVTLGTDACSNFSKLKSAIMEANSEEMLTVKISKSGNYPIDSGSGGSLMMRSNVMLDLNGSTLSRSGGMYNFMQNEDYDGYRSNTGYNQTVNFGFKNGTIDGLGGSTDEVNLINLGHATGITIENVNFKNCRNGHLIEVTSCKDVVISNCTFTGLLGTPSGENEAIQIDIANNQVAGSWNGVYASDSGVCKNVKVDGCTFYNYPSGVGNHHTITNNHCSNIQITNNKFYNELKTSQPAIWCYGFENSVVKGNTVNGNYSTGIMVSGGSVAVEDNTITNAKYSPLYITVSNSYVAGKNNVRTEEPAHDCAVRNNTLTTTAKESALSVFSGSGVTEISGNSLGSSGETALMISASGTKVGTIKNNSIQSDADLGILIAKYSYVDTIENNSILGKTEGIQVSSNGSVKNINSNRIIGTNSSGILVTSATATNINGNKIWNCGECGIFVSSSGVVGNVIANTIYGCGDYGLRINNSNITVGIGDNNIYSNTSGSSKINARVVEAVDTNLPAPVLKSATNTYDGVVLSWESVSRATKYRVFYKESGASSWTKLGDTAGTSSLQSGLTSGKTYVFTVRCITSDGKTYTSSYDPNGISLMYVAPPKVTSVSCVNEGVKLGWSSVKGAASYRVFYKNSKGGWTKLGDTASTTFTDTKVSSGSTYTYTVRCLDSKGSYCSGYYEKGWNGTYVAPPKITSTQSVANGVKINWGAVKGAAQYRVFYKNSKGGWSKLGDTTSTTFTDTKVSSGTTYTYTVRCMNANASAYTSGYDAAGTNGTFLSVPKISRSTSDLNGVNLYWGSVKGAAKYRVFYKNGKGNWVKLGDTTSTSFTDTVVKTGATYTYTVRCVSSDGSAYTSAYDNNGFKATYSPVPAISGAESTSEGVKLSWSAVKGAAKYRVFYKNGKGNWVKLGDTASTTFTDTVVKNGGTYTYTVRCINSAATAYTSSYDATGKTFTYHKPQQTQQLSMTVYWLEKGDVYHTDRNCRYISGRTDVYSGTNPPAGRRACAVCG